MSRTIIGNSCFVLVAGISISVYELVDQFHSKSVANTNDDIQLLKEWHLEFYGVVMT